MLVDLLCAGWFWLMGWCRSKHEIFRVDVDFCNVELFVTMAKGFQTVIDKRKKGWESCFPH